MPFVSVIHLMPVINLWYGGRWCHVESTRFIQSRFCWQCKGFFYILLGIQLYFISTNNFNLTSLWKKKKSGKPQIPLDLQTHRTYSAFCICSAWKSVYLTKTLWMCLLDNSECHGGFKNTSSCGEQLSRLCGVSTDVTARGCCISVKRF